MPNTKIYRKIQKKSKKNNAEIQQVDNKIQRSTHFKFEKNTQFEKKKNMPCVRLLLDLVFIDPNFCQMEKRKIRTVCGSGVYKSYSANSTAVIRL